MEPNRYLLPFAERHLINSVLHLGVRCFQHQMIVPQAGIHKVRPSPVSAREEVRLIVDRQPRSGSGAHGSIGPAVVELDEMLVGIRRQWRRVRINDPQSVLAVLQQGSPVNDAKHSMEARSTRGQREVPVA